MFSSIKMQALRFLHIRSIYVLLALVFPLSLYTKLVDAKMNVYLNIISPSANSAAVNGNVMCLQWQKGQLDGVANFDLQMAQLSVDGLQPIALSVPANSGAICIEPQDLPEGDDYFAIFFNQTHGLVYGISPQFSIVNSTSQLTSANATVAGPMSGQATGYGANGGKGPIPTVTISGPPNPTKTFATTFPVLASAALRQIHLTLGAVGTSTLVALSMTLGAIWTLL